MAFLFVVENSVAKPTTEALLIEPFSTIWKRDRSENKTQALKEFTYIEFMTSHKKTNPYAGFDEHIKAERLAKDVMKDENYSPDPLVETAMAKLVEFQTEASATYTYYMSSLKGAEKLKKFLNNFDITERNERNGNPIYKPRDITSALKDTSSVLKDLNGLKEKVEQELFETTKTIGNKVINRFEM